ncbi:7-cyano-7-deazaguanine synthase QueC [Nitrosomonas oligotropha]|uniref:7-cyano-7-deazaguanine synthase n=1 Tax=Nitrosomonas oligotropha TaxID=42354 RepID=A0A1H8NSB7_9PROT|nr:7-cyano-7-deazaguanine synthase QueC [Nitrosomonas oligotropha]SDW62410.1 preQ(0) biosynthesis protein QueC [Nitrosomonas oligotropha]SEO32228.1 preQ(0) biosynthesis protein QueC [Nitrosomonas oligotropha]
MKKAVVLLSGGLDSATVLAIARDQGFQCYALSVDYGQRHRSELEAARKVAQSLHSHAHQIIRLDLTAFGGSALTDRTMEIPTSGEKTEIPVTYVPARNTIMLSLALAWAETLQSQDIFVGVNAVDYSGYPDCRPEYIQAFEQMANLATKAGVEGKKLNIHVPLMHLSKKEIIQAGLALGVDYGLTVSCYQADEMGRACGICDSCRIRKAGFAAAGVSDSTCYRLRSV